MSRYSLSKYNGPVERDAVDRNIDLWQKELPHLDRGVEGVVSRIQKLARYLDKTYGETARQFGLTLGELEVLTSLRLCGTPHELSPSALSERLMISSGAMTNRLDKLERAGFIERAPDPADRRGVIVHLTSDGEKKFREAISLQIEKEKKLVDVLDEEKRSQLESLLRELMVWFEQSLGDPVTRGAVYEEPI